jgi:hypothetical protein
MSWSGVEIYLTGQFASDGNSLTPEIPISRHNSEPCKNCCFTAAGFSLSTSKDIWHDPLVNPTKKRRLVQYDFRDYREGQTDERITAY